MLCENPVCKNIFIAGFLRATFASTTIAFLPVFFQRLYPTFKSTFSVINAFSLIGFGFSSSIIGGIISDRYEKKSYMSKTLVIILGNLIGLPLFALMCFTSNFWIAMVCNGLSLLFQSSYLAPAITMM